MHSMMEGEDGVEPHDVFVDLGVLIVEGRIPGGAWAAGRGYGEGPHCAGVGISGLPVRHDCDTNNSFLCKRAENFRKHMQLLWQNNIPLCIEVLLCADCQCGQQKAQSPEVANIPSSTDLLLEQWIVTMVTKRCPEMPQISVRGLFQAVRSQLHFSQLSAWWSCSKGGSPAHVNYRVTVPGEAFASQFQRQPVEHSFPVASISRGTAVKVYMRTLPRMAAVPRIQCPLHDCETEQKRPVAESDLLGAVGGTACCKDETFRWGEVTSKQPAADPLLGESLLDPPQSLDLFARRYQSPSRCGSPSMETPEYLMFGHGVTPVRPEVGTSRPLSGRWRDNSPPSPPLSSQNHRRLGRQGLVRRRDASNVSASASSGSGTSTWQKSPMLPGLVDDRMQNPCTRPGKHHCRCAFDEDLDILPPTGKGQDSSIHEPALPCKPSSKPNASCTPLSAPKRDEPLLDCAQVQGTLPSEDSKMGRLNLELSRREFEEVLSVLRDRNDPPNHSVGKKLAPKSRKATSLRQDLVYTVPSCLPSTSKAAASDKADLLMGAILRSHKADDASSSLLAKCDQRSKPCDKCELIDERTIPTSLIRTTRTEISKRATVKTHNPQCLSIATNGKCSDHVPLKLTSVEDRTKRGASDSDDMIQPEADDRRNIDMPFLNKSLGRIKELFKGEVKPTQNVENTTVLERPVPSAQDKAKFRRSLDSAASMVFHCQTGLPLTSSPAPVRRGTTCFDFDSTLNSVSAIRSALFESVPAAPADDALSVSSDDAESETGARSPCSPGIGGPTVSLIGPFLWSHYTLAPCASLLGSFEESVLNGRLEPVSTVQGFTAELGASGSFCPRHLVLPVTVFFYTLGDNDKVSTPYLGHINLGKKGYNVPRSGTIQVTLFNPLGTVVKMFVVMYDLADMPVSSQTFLRQRTLYMPANPNGEQPDNAQKWLRYLIHLRFSSSKSGRIYLHSDIRMIIFRKSDVDTATAHGMDMAYELRSFTHGPTNPKFSPYK